MPFILSALLAHAASPWLRRLQQAGMRRDAAILVLYSVLGGGSVLAGYFGVSVLASEAVELRAKAPEYAARAMPALRTKRLGSFPAGERAAEWLESHREEIAAEATRRAPEVATFLAEAALYFFLVPFISFFIMAGTPKLLHEGLASCPSRHVERLLNLIFALDETIGRYLRGVILEAVIVGALAFAGLWAIGLNYSLWLAVLVGAANLIPYLGLVIGGVPALVVAFLQFGEPAALGKVCAVFAMAKLIDDLLLQPLIMQRAVHLHPVLVFFALSCGAELGGLIGLVFAVPVACILRLLLSTAQDWYRSEFRGGVPELVEVAPDEFPPILT